MFIILAIYYQNIEIKIIKQTLSINKLKMRWWEVIKRYVFPTLITTMYMDSYRRQLRSDANHAEAAFQLAQKTNDLLKRETILNQVQHNKLSALVSNANEKLADVDSIQAKIDRLSTKLNNNSFGPGETMQSALSDITRYKTDLEKAQEISNKPSKEVYEYVLEVKNSDIFGWVWDLIDRYNLFLDTLTLDQKVAIINLMGYFTLLNSALTILLILVGNHYIQLWNLEAKFPRLSNLLKARAKLSRVYLRIHIILFFVVLLGYIGANLYMLYLRSGLI